MAGIEDEAEAAEGTRRRRRRRRRSRSRSSSSSSRRRRRRRRSRSCWCGCWLVSPHAAPSLTLVCRCECRSSRTSSQHPRVLRSRRQLPLLCPSLQQTPAAAHTASFLPRSHQGSTAEARPVKNRVSYCTLIPEHSSKAHQKRGVAKPMPTNTADRTLFGLVHSTPHRTHALTHPHTHPPTRAPID